MHILSLKQLEPRRDRSLTKMLKGVLSNLHCLAKFSRETGLTPYLGPAHYIYACCLKSQMSCSSPPSDWLAPWLSNRLCDSKIREALLSCHSSTPDGRTWNACKLALLRHVCGISSRRHRWESAITLSDTTREEWEATFVPLSSTHRDPTEHPLCLLHQHPFHQMKKHFYS